MMGDVDELVGLWDSGPFAYGSMESSELALLSDSPTRTPGSGETSPRLTGP
jgi:hypothetical protein